MSRSAFRRPSEFTTNARRFECVEPLLSAARRAMGAVPTKASLGTLALFFLLTACGAAPGDGEFDDALEEGSIARTSSALSTPGTCLRTYRDHNYGGTRWDFFCGGNNPGFSSWNDRITSIIVPSGYKLVAFEHSQFKGRVKEFIGKVPNVGGDFNDIISSFRLVPFDSSRCIRAFRDAGYRGESWNFCSGLPNPPHGRWNDQITSIQVPPGMKAKFCTDVSNGKPRGTCRTYFGSSDNIGGFLNDKFSFVTWGGFHSDDFALAVASDTQYGFCVADHCKTVAGNDKTANLWHVDSIKKAADFHGFHHFGGVIVNGDLTNTEDKSQLNDFKHDYEEKYGFNVWPGLGNHDYDNYWDKWCKGDGWDLWAKNYCTKRMLDYVIARADSLNPTRFDYGRDGYTHRGSLAYSWDIGRFHFVQLHNYQAYERSVSVYRSSKARHEHYEIRKALDWLDLDLAPALAAGSFAVINMHITSHGTDREKFLNILDKYPNVVAIFGGHSHACGKQSPVTTPSGREIPVFHAGAAEHNTYLTAEFRCDKIRVSQVDSTHGDFAPLLVEEVVLPTDLL